VIEWLFFLLPVAAASGWWAAKRSAERDAKACGPDPAYFHGLNYLLDEQPDKAIELFLQLADDRETAEIQLALGGLFRRRGEVDRAIRIHQGLTARSRLAPSLRTLALYELGQDYLQAGLLDRAETLFQELIALNAHRRRALEGLLTIYQQEREWEQCMAVARQLQERTGKSMGAEIAHYHCELAEAAWRRGDEAAGEKALTAAQSSDASCTRAVLLQARWDLEKGRTQAALDRLRRGGVKALAFLGEILPELSACYVGRPAEEWVAALRKLDDGSGNTALVLHLSEALNAAEGPQAAADLLKDYLHRYADLAASEQLLRLIEAHRQEPQLRQYLATLAQAIGDLQARQPAYRCEHCGFQGHQLHWQCPSCRHWGSIQPLSPPKMDASA